jgi:ABC-type antimicrobial peptide transport system permease subunit
MKVTVIGVARDVREYGIRAKAMPQAYLPLTVDLPFNSYGHLTVKTRVTPTAVIPEIRRQLHAMDGTLALNQPQTMNEVISADTQDVSLQTFLLGTFATLALILAAVGLYGVMSYLVSQRTREIGIRMALGAERGTVLYLIMKRGTTLTLLGMVIGASAGLALTRGMSTLLYGVSSADPMTFAAVAVVLATVALAAYFIPARRATKIDPMLALRYE